MIQTTFKSGLYSSVRGSHLLNISGVPFANPNLQLALACQLSFYGLNVSVYVGRNCLHTKNAVPVSPSVRG